MTQKNSEVSVVKRGNMLPAVQAKQRESFLSPSTDVHETPEAYVLMLDIPGVSREAINVILENAVLSVRARVQPYHSEEAVLHFNELKQVTYHRIFNLGDGIDRDSVNATYENGVLAIKLFKNKKAKPREIPIK